MKRNASFISITWLVATIVVTFATSNVRAAELKLAGVRLNEPIISVLARWGKPTGIGPLAQVATGGMQSTTSIAGPRPGLGMGGPGMMGGGMMRQGMGGGMMRQGMGNTTPGTPGTGEAGGPGMGMGMGGGMGGPGMMGGGMMRPGMGGGAGMMSGGGTVGVLNQKAKGELRGNEGMQYWLYKRPGGVQVIIGVEPAGNVSTITVKGLMSKAALTSRGIYLGSRYSQIEAAYGYPDSTRSVPGGLEVSYPERDVRFGLKRSSFLFCVRNCRLKTSL